MSACMMDCLSQRLEEKYMLTDLLSWSQARGHRVMTVSPRYDQYKDAWDTSTPTEVCTLEFCLNR